MKLLSHAQTSALGFFFKKYSVIDYTFLLRLPTDIDFL